MTPEDKRVLFQWALSLVNVCVGAAIGVGSAVVVADRNAKHAAGAKLRAAFAPELALMRATPSVDRTSLEQIKADPQTDLDRVLQAAFPRHAAAVAGPASMSRSEHRPATMRPGAHTMQQEGASSSASTKSVREHPSYSANGSRQSAATAR